MQLWQPFNPALYDPMPTGIDLPVGICGLLPLITGLTIWKVAEGFQVNLTVNERNSFTVCIDKDPLVALERAFAIKFNLGRK